MKAMNKRICAMLLAMLMAVCLTSCGEQPQEDVSEPAAVVTTTTTADTTTTTATTTQSTTTSVTTTTSTTTKATTTTTQNTTTSVTVTSTAPKTTTTTTTTTTTAKPTTTATTTTWKAPEPIDWREVERLVAEKINEYRVAEGSTPATVLPGLTEVARYRSNQLITNFAHDIGDMREAFAYFKYGEVIDMTIHGLDASENYYDGASGEAIACGSKGFAATDEAVAADIAEGFYESKGHWRYVGSSEKPYIAVGITPNPGGWRNWYCCVLVSDTNYG